MWRTKIGHKLMTASTVLVLGLLLPTPPAVAEPPPQAPAHGWRTQQNQGWAWRQDDPRSPWRSLAASGGMSTAYRLPAPPPAGSHGDPYRDQFGRLCRDYTKTAWIGRRLEQLHGTVCLNADGIWEQAN